MENQGYVDHEYDDTRVSSRQSYNSEYNMTDHVTSGSVRDLPPGEEVIEPVIVRTTAAESSTIFDAARSANRRSYSPDGAPDRSSYMAGFGDVYQENELWGREGDGQRSGSRASSDVRSHSAQSHRKLSHSPAIAINDEEIGDDGFPWTPPKRTSYPNTDMDSSSITMYHDMRRESRASTIVDATEKTKRFLWWRRLVKKLQDNRVETQEAMQKMLFLEQNKDKHFRRLKKILNMVFLVAGLLLLLAIIVLIIYTDPQFNESMKALTVFLAGRRQGIW